MIADPIEIVLYRTMYRIRKVEEKLYYLFSIRDMPGTMHQCIGQEAVAAGVCAALRKADYITSTHRGHGHCLAKGVDLKGFMAEMFAKSTGCCKGMGGSMHIADFSVGMLGANGIVGGGIPIAVGAGVTCKRKGEGNIAVSFFGDGASNEGSFHESLNLAAAWRLPVVFVCENNLYGFSTHYRRVTAIENLSDRAAAYGMEGVTCDGMDALDVYAKTSAVVEGVRAGGMPVLVECKTYRYMGHARFEKPNYRPPAEVAEWKEKDAIAKLRAHLIALGLQTAGEVKALEQGVDDEIEAAVAFAESSPPPEPSSYTNYLFA